MIAGRRPQVLIDRRVIDDLELAEEPVFEVGRDSTRPADAERFCLVARMRYSSNVRPELLAEIRSSIAPARTDAVRTTVLAEDFR